ncbi:MAG: CBS domain-containing protein [Nannocystaceae bacterium]
MHSPIKIREYMTPVPETIDPELTIPQAAERMFNLGIRHLPVVQGGNLVGILSERDVSFIQGLADYDAKRCTVAQAMHANPFTCGPEAHLDAVAREMAEHKYGAAVVVDRDHPSHVVGVFTTIDALRALTRLSE